MSTIEDCSLLTVYMYMYTVHVINSGSFVLNPVVTVDVQGLKFQILQFLLRCYGISRLLSLNVHKP